MLDYRDVIVNFIGRMNNPLFNIGGGEFVLVEDNSSVSIVSKGSNGTDRCLVKMVGGDNYRRLVIEVMACGIMDIYTKFATMD